MILDLDINYSDLPFIEISAKEIQKKGQCLCKSKYGVWLTCIDRAQGTGHCATTCNLSPI